MIHPHVTILADRQMTARAITERAADRATAARLARAPLPAVAASLADRLREHFDPATLPVQQVLALAEEAGEFTAAYRRWAGLARRTGPWHDVEAELADVVITAYVTAPCSASTWTPPPAPRPKSCSPAAGANPRPPPDPHPGNHPKEGTPVMANEPTTTVTGNLTADPELRFTPTGRPVAAFTIANTPRFPDRATGEWQDGETWFVRCSAWGDMAENIAASLSRGNAVVATGRLAAAPGRQRRRQAGHRRDDRGRHRPEPAPRRRQGHQGHPRARRRQRHRGRGRPPTSGAPPRQPERFPPPRRGLGRRAAVLTED